MITEQWIRDKAATQKLIADAEPLDRVLVVVERPNGTIDLTGCGHGDAEAVVCIMAKALHEIAHGAVRDHARRI